jgi:phosphotransferase system  glucose/maltose/N-acetylglucosamine-specific IIC component
MKFNLQGFIDVLTFQVPWMEANFFWVFISVAIYLLLPALIIAWLIKISSEANAAIREEDEAMTEEERQIAEQQNKEFNITALKLTAATLVCICILVLVIEGIFST